MQSIIQVRYASLIYGYTSSHYKCKGEQEIKLELRLIYFIIVTERLLLGAEVVSWRFVLNYLFTVIFQSGCIITYYICSQMQT